MAWWRSTGQHEVGPAWAQAHGALLREIDRKLGAVMASQQELTDGVHSLFGVVDLLVTRIGEAKASGAFDPAAADALLAEVNSERQRAADALASVNPPAPPAAPPA